MSFRAAHIASALGTRSRKGRSPDGPKRNRIGTFGACHRGSGPSPVQLGISNYTSLRLPLPRAYFRDLLYFDICFLGEYIRRRVLAVSGIGAILVVGLAPPESGLCPLLPVFPSIGAIQCRGACTPVLHWSPAFARYFHRASHHHTQSIIQWMG